MSSLQKGWGDMRDVRSHRDASHLSIGANDTVQVEENKKLNLCCGRLAILINSRVCGIVILSPRATGLYAPCWQFTHCWIKAQWVACFYLSNWCPNFVVLFYSFRFKTWHVSSQLTYSNMFTARCLVTYWLAAFDHAVAVVLLWMDFFFYRNMQGSRKVWLFFFKAFQK